MPNTARRSLTRDEIVEKAMRLARRVGLNGLSMRQLGDELGVWPMAVYHHVPNKEALVSLVADAALAELDFPEMDRLAAPESVEDWLTASVAQTRAGRRLFLRYPGLAEFILSHRPTRNGLRIAEMQLTGLRKLGATAEEAAKIYLTTTAWALTLVQSETLQRDRVRERRRSRRTPCRADRRTYRSLSGTDGGRDALRRHRRRGPVRVRDELCGRRPANRAGADRAEAAGRDRLV